VYAGLEEGLAVVAGVLREQGPFDGVIGFSQGAALAAMVASLLEPDRKAAFAAAAAPDSQGRMPYPEPFAELEHLPLKFAASFAGFAAENQAYIGFYEPKIQTSFLAVVGTMDTVVDESWTSKLVEACQDVRVVAHPGGHFVPGSKKEVGVVADFIKSVTFPKSDVGRERASNKEGEDVLDMDMPF